MTDSQKRKNSPVFSGVLQYFPDALLAVSQHSKAGNDKHNPGQPLHWSKGKSTDHADCIARHLIDIGPNWDLKDPETGSYHATALAWRALALLQILIEREKDKEMTDKFLEEHHQLMDDLAKQEEEDNKALAKLEAETRHFPTELDENSKRFQEVRAP